MEFLTMNPANGVPINVAIPRTIYRLPLTLANCAAPNSSTIEVGNKLTYALANVPLENRKGDEERLPRSLLRRTSV